MQLNRYLALCGVAARRKANEFIVQGRISVNHERVQKLGRVVNVENDEICLDGCRLKLPGKIYYILLNKPGGYLTTARDPRGRKIVMDLVNVKERIFPVGRLDYDTEGVLLLTNDGDLAYRLAHPKYEMEKVYEAWVEGKVTGEALKILRSGVPLNNGFEVRGEAAILKRESDQTLVEIKIHEGRKRQIKRMMKYVRHPVLFLKRTRFAGLTANGLQIGDWRELTSTEIKDLYNKTGLEQDS